jgi:hypothetical protein
VFVCLPLCDLVGSRRQRRHKRILRNNEELSK